MDERADVDPNNWRTWLRDGRRLLPPPGATASYCVTAVCEFSAEVWGVDPNEPLRRDVVRAFKKIDGKYVQVLSSEAGPT